MALTDIDGQRLGDSVADKLGDRNLIINGAMQVAQRGTSFTVTNNPNDYAIDRFVVGNIGTNSSAFTVTQSTDAPVGFSNSLKVDCTTADTSLAADHQSKIEHRIEGLNVAHLGYGTANAQTVTLSFYIKSNLTGNTQVAFVNAGNNRSYVATFTIDAANTWERKVLTIPGDTSGTWATDNTIGLRLRWGTFGSDFQTSSVNQWNAGQFMSRNDSPINFSSSTSDELYLTGVQLEVGNTATPFQHEPYAKTLSKCQRYFCKTFPQGVAPVANPAVQQQGAIGFLSPAAGNWDAMWQFPVTMRDNPSSVITYSPNNTGSNWYTNGGSTPNATVTNTGDRGVQIRAGGVNNGFVYWIHVTAEAEL